MIRAPRLARPPPRPLGRPCLPVGQDVENTLHVDALTPQKVDPDERARRVVARVRECGSRGACPESKSYLVPTPFRTWVNSGLRSNDSYASKKLNGCSMTSITLPCSSTCACVVASWLASSRRCRMNRQGSSSSFALKSPTTNTWWEWWSTSERPSERASERLGASEV